MRLTIFTVAFYFSLSIAVAENKSICLLTKGDSGYSEAIDNSQLVEGYSCVDKYSQETVCIAKFTHSFQAWLPNVDSTSRQSINLFDPITSPNPRWFKCKIYFNPIFNSCEHSRVRTDKKCLSGETRSKPWKGESLNFKIFIDKSTGTGTFQDKNQTSYATQNGFDDMDLLDCKSFK